MITLRGNHTFYSEDWKYILHSYFHNWGKEKKNPPHIWNSGRSYLYEEKSMPDIQNITAWNFVTKYQQRRHYTPVAAD
jgi:hypothetical protein